MHKQAQKLMNLDTLFNQTRDEMYHYIVRRVDNNEDAKDIMQSVFLKVVEKKHSLSEIQNPRGWLFTIARNTIIDYYRKSKYKVYNNRLDAINIAREIEYAKKVTTELDLCIHRLIQELPEKYQYVIKMIEIKGIKQKDLAEELKIPYPSLRSRVQRGREKLKELMLKHCHYNLGYCELLKQLDRSSCQVCQKETNSLNQNKQL